MPISEIHGPDYIIRYPDHRTLSRRLFDWISAMFYSIGYVTHHRP